jgi:aryl carrier-like protein
MDDSAKSTASSEEPAGGGDGAATELQARLATAGDDERERLLRETVREQATTILNTASGDDSNFLENGLNSLTALELTKTLMTLTGVEIPMVAIVENPTPTELGRHLAEELSDAVRR